MDFKDTIKQLADRIEKLKDNIQTEEATKNAFIMPFITSKGLNTSYPRALIMLWDMMCSILWKYCQK